MKIRKWIVIVAGIAFIPVCLYLLYGVYVSLPWEHFRAKEQVAKWRLPNGGVVTYYEVPVFPPMIIAPLPVPSSVAKYFVYEIDGVSQTHLINRSFGGFRGVECRYDSDQYVFIVELPWNKADGKKLGCVFNLKNNEFYTYWLCQYATDEFGGLTPNSGVEIEPFVMPVER
ncbi:MAG: hypothetical protein NTV79_10180 [Candidatus Aureabacteria bacterium]|nr:hypothetical protein [Candidatus Auribacterota bacterium]